MVFGNVDKFIEWNAAVCNKIIGRYGGIMKNSQPQIGSWLDFRQKWFIPGGTECFLFGCGPMNVDLIDVDENIWIDCAVDQLSGQAHIMTALKICRP